MRKQAETFFQAALDGLSHADEHLAGHTDKDNSQVILSLFYAMEMLMKAARLEQTKDIFRRRGHQTISFGEALDDFKNLTHAPDMRMLEEDRHSLQHFAQFAHRSRVEGHMESSLRFADELVKNHFGLDLAKARGVSEPQTHAVTVQGEALDPSDALQRDAGFGGGVLVWAQGRTGSDKLGLRVRGADGSIRWVSDEEHFEYMPQTDGRHVVAYRQSGGVILYDLQSGRRDILSETGGPGAIRDGIVTAQGLGIEDGLGGGVWLIPLDSGEPEQLDEQGDSPRISDGRVVWQSLQEGHVVIRMRSVEGGEVVTVETDVNGAAIDGRLLAWSERSGRPPLWVLDIDADERIRIDEAGIFPDVRGNLITYLRHTNDSYDLVVYDFEARKPLLELEKVGFPTGRGPVLTDSDVVWESGGDKGVNHLRFAPLP
jgi:hypothetical protein